MNAADHEKFARDALAVLVERVLSPDIGDKRIAYIDLARHIDFPKKFYGPGFPGQIGKTLGAMGRQLRCLARNAPVPKIQSLVVNKNQKIPGAGYSEFHKGWNDLSQEEQRRIAGREQSRVLEFGDKWLAVLDSVGTSGKLARAIYCRLREGAERQAVVKRYERNAYARDLCIEEHGCSCSVCGLDFGQEYGEIGQGFIHIHHIRELSQIREEHDVDPVNDLRPVCPNCHAMLHHKARPARSIDDLKKAIAQNKRPAVARKRVKS